MKLLHAPNTPVPGPSWDWQTSIPEPVVLCGLMVVSRRAAQVLCELTAVGLVWSPQQPFCFDQI